MKSGMPLHSVLKAIHEWIAAIGPFGPYLPLSSISGFASAFSEGRIRTSFGCIETAGSMSRRPRMGSHISGGAQFRVLGGRRDPAWAAI
jgi:hypothetical protein